MSITAKLGGVLHRGIKGGSFYAAVALLIGSAATFAYWRSVYSEEYANAFELASGDLEDQVSESKTALEVSFDRVYDALRLIGRFSHQPQAEGHLPMTADTLAAARAVYAELASDFTIHGMYIALPKAENDTADIVSLSSDGDPLTAARQTVIQNQLRSFRSSPPRVGATDEDALFTPVAAGEGVDCVACSVPWYAADGHFLGIITSLVSTTVFAENLEGEFLTLRHPATGLHIEKPGAKAAVGKAWDALCRTGVVDGYAFNQSVTLTLPGKQTWDASMAVPLDVLLQNPDFASVRSHSRTVTVGGASLTLLLTALTWLMMTSRARALRLAESMTASLKVAKEGAESANRAKSEFLARMSHEIRTPLNGVVGMIDLLVHTGMTGVQTRYATLAKEAAAALLVVINDILDFSKIESGKLELESVEFELPTLVEDVIALFTPVASKHSLVLGAVVRPNVPQSVTGDPNKLRQIVTNFISNALKFTAKGSVTVDVSVEDSNDNGLTVRIEVQDTGIGIPAERLDRLFKSFSQVDSSTTRKFGGTGLGLAISKRLIELMGGMVGVRSKEGQGTTFWMTLPFVAAHTPANEQDRRARLQGLRLLAVEPNEVHRVILRRQTEGWLAADTVIAIGDADVSSLLLDAIDADRPFAAVLLPHGCNQPSNFMADLTADPRLRNLRTIAVTEADDQTTAEAVARHGFAARLQRPLQQSALWSAMEVSAKPISPTELTEAEAPPLMGMHLLVAEDNEMNQFVTEETLRRMGCTCEMVGDGVAAVRAALGRRYDAVLMDCHMPEMDGLAAASKIRDAERADPARGRLPIIALTADAIQGDRESCLAAGMDGYVSKPIDADLLVRTILQLTAGPRTAVVAPAAPAESTAPATPKAETAHPDKAKSADVPPIDVKSLLTRCMNDRHFATSTLRKFSSRATCDAEVLKDVAAAGSVKELMRLSHNLKSVAAHVGAAALRQAAADIEQAAGTGDLSNITAQLLCLQQAAEQCAAYLPTALKALTESHSAAQAA